MIATSNSNTFTKEILLALLILGNCLMLPLHLLASEEQTTITILGYEYVHRFLDNQGLVWYLLFHLQILIYIGLFFYHCRKRYRWAILYSVYWILYGLLEVVFDPWTTEDDFWILETISISITLLLVVVIIFSAFKKGNTQRLFTKAEKSKLDLPMLLLLIGIPFFGKFAGGLPYNLKELSIFGHIVSDHGFPNVGGFIWFLLLKVNVLMVVLLLYFNVAIWWRYALLFPILLSSFQIRTALNPDLEHVDAYEIVEAAPFLVLVLLILLLLSNTAYYQSKMKQLYQRTYDHLELVIQKRFGQRELFLTKTKGKWEVMQKKQDLEEEELLQLKQHLEQELQKQP